MLQDLIEEDWSPIYDEYTDTDWCDEKAVDSQTLQDLIEEDQSPRYDEYADSDWYNMEDALHSLCQGLQARISPPP